MTNSSPSRGPVSSSLIIGVILVVVGLIFLAGQLISQYTEIDLSGMLWPFFIIIPGVALLLAGIFTSKDEGIAIFGSIVTTVGLLLLYQNISGHWESWAYAWALVAPTSIGVGQLLYGALRNRPKLVSEGVRIAGVGIIIFLVGVFFFELILGIGGFGLGAIGWSLLLIVAGVAVLVFGLFGRRRSG